MMQLFGPSGAGKSVIGAVAGSVWGGGADGLFVEGQSHRQRPGAPRRRPSRAAFVVLDETRVADQPQSGRSARSASIASAVMRLAEGRVKGRMNEAVFAPGGEPVDPEPVEQLARRDGCRPWLRDRRGAPGSSDRCPPSDRRRRRVREPSRVSQSRRALRRAAPPLAAQQWGRGGGILDAPDQAAFARRAQSYCGPTEPPRSLPSARSKADARRLRATWSACTKSLRQPSRALTWPASYKYSWERELLEGALIECEAAHVEYVARVRPDDCSPGAGRRPVRPSRRARPRPPRVVRRPAGRPRRPRQRPRPRRLRRVRQPGSRRSRASVFPAEAPADLRRQGGEPGG